MSPPLGARPSPSACSFFTLCSRALPPSTTKVFLLCILYKPLLANSFAPVILLPILSTRPRSFFFSNLFLQLYVTGEDGGVLQTRKSCTPAEAGGRRKEGVGRMREAHRLLDVSDNPVAASISQDSTLLWCFAAWPREDRRLDHGRASTSTC